MASIFLGSVLLVILGQLPLPGQLPWPIVIGYGFGGLIIGYILYLLLSPKGSMVFSDEYKEIIARTPHIRYKSSCLMVFLIVFVVVLVVIGLFAFIGARR